MSKRPEYVEDVNDIVWHPDQNYTYKQYVDALYEAFYFLFFKNANLRFILIGSYRMNLRNMVLYAIENHIDEIEYIKSIRRVLLDSKCCCELCHGK